MLRTPPVHREGSLPRVRRLVNHIYGSAIRRQARLLQRRGLPFNGTRKDERPVAGYDRPSLISPRGSLVEALGVCGKGLQRTAWEPLRTWDAAAS